MTGTIHVRTLPDRAGSDGHRPGGYRPPATGAPRALVPVPSAAASTARKRPAARRDRVPGRLGPAGPGPGIAVAVVGPPGPGRDELCRMLSGRPPVGQPVVASSTQAVPSPPPDLVVLHTVSPSRDLREPGAGCRVLVVSAVTDEDEVVEALRAGATSYLVEGQYTCAELIAAVLGTAAGHSYLSPSALTAVVQRLQGNVPLGAPAEVLAVLSGREREIMALVAAGHLNAGIAQQLFLSEKTVRNHLHRVYGKLGVRSRSEAVITWLGRGPLPAGAAVR